MKILIINGSPKNEKSNTLKLANAFISGINADGNHLVEKITVAEKNIEPCRGCYCCWEKTPGKCVIKDDMELIFDKYNNADLVIWSFPLYYYGIPSKTKALIDRLLPNNMPDMCINEDGSTGHLQRNNPQNQKHALISTCGFYTVDNNYEALVKQFEFIFGNRLTTIMCPQGESFRVPQLTERTDEYLAYVAQAGEEYIRQGFLSSDTHKKLSEPLFPAEQFMEMANLSWEKGQAIEINNEAERLLRQMAVIYKPHGKEKDIIFEFYFTDMKKTYQLVLGKKNCIFKDSDFTPYTMRIETPFETWLAISEGKLNGKEALFRHMYSVTGDFNSVEYLDSCFSATSSKRKKEPSGKKRAMWLCILPWSAFWMSIPFSPYFGVFITLAITAAMPLFYAIRKATVYDAISVFAVTALCIPVIAHINPSFIIVLSYFLFGLIWLVSLCTPIPLCAWYSSGKWGDDDAFDNPLFILTNRIICAGWGGIYIFSSLLVWVMAHNGYSQFIWLPSIVFPAVMGTFTALFAQKFPAYYAGKAQSA